MEDNVCKRESRTNMTELDKLKTIRDHLSAVSTDNIVVEAYKMSAFALMMHAIREIEDKEYEDYQGI